MRPHQSYLEREGIYYFPKSKRNIKNERDKEENYYYSEYSPFLEKLLQFAEIENLKRIRSNYNIETKIHEELKERGVKKILFKVSDLIIEKKTTAEIEKKE